MGYNEDKRICKIEDERLTAYTKRTRSGSEQVFYTGDDVEHKADKQDALSAMPEEYNPSDFHYKDEITCPYCAYEFRDSWESAEDVNKEHECPRCDNTFKVTAMTTLTFDCSRIKA